MEYQKKPFFAESYLMTPKEVYEGWQKPTKSYHPPPSLTKQSAQSSKDDPELCHRLTLPRVMSDLYV
jgi:hypothetical protein